MVPISSCGTHLFMWYPSLHVVPISSCGTHLFMWYPSLHVVPISSCGTHLFMWYPSLHVVHTYIFRLLALFKQEHILFKALKRRNQNSMYVAVENKLWPASPPHTHPCRYHYCPVTSTWHGFDTVLYALYTAMSQHPSHHSEDNNLNTGPLEQATRKPKQRLQNQTSSQTARNP